MKTNIILGTCLSALTVAVLTLPVLAAKTTPALCKAKCAHTLKIKGTKVNNLSLKNSKTPVVSLKKSK